MLTFDVPVEPCQRADGLGGHKSSKDDQKISYRGDILDSSVQGQDGPDIFPTGVELSGYSSWAHAPSTHSDNLPPFPQADWCRHLVTSVKHWFYCILKAPVRFTRTYRMEQMTSEWDLLYIGSHPVRLVLTRRVNFTLLTIRNVHLAAHTIWHARGCQFPWKILKIFEKVRCYHHFDQMCRCNIDIFNWP